MNNAQLTMRWVVVWLGALLLVEAHMPTVFDVLLHAVRNLDGLVEGAATADGSTTTLIDSHLGTAWTGRANDEFNGGSLFLKTNQIADGVMTDVADEVLGQVSGSRYIHANLGHTPVTAGSLVVDVNGFTIDDDGLGKLSDLPIAATNIALLSGAGPYDLQAGNITPGSVIIKETGASPDRLYYDDGQGSMVALTTGVKWATVDYDLGIITLLPDQTGLAALSLADYTYTTFKGTINYDTGEVFVRFATVLVSAVVTADYEYGYALFVPLIANVSDFEAGGGTVTFESGALKVATTAGDLYGVMTRRYPRWLLFQKLNEVLLEIKDYVSTSTTLVSAIVNDQIAVASTARVVRVLAGNADTTDRAWQVVTRYTRLGEVIRLIDGAPPDTDTIAVETLGTPAQVTSESTQISEWYSAEWLGLETAARCMRWRLQQPGADAALVTTLLNDLLRRAKDAKAALTAWRSVSVKWPEYPEN